MGREVLGDAIEKPTLNGLKRANTAGWVKPGCEKDTLQQKATMGDPKMAQ
jgi:hypothetical protein